MAETPSYADFSNPLAGSVFGNTDCSNVFRACDEALKAKDAQVEALKKAVIDARKEADDCYAKKKETSSGGWLVPLVIGIAGGVLLGVAVGR